MMENDHTDCIGVPKGELGLTIFQAVLIAKRKWAFALAINLS